MGKKVELIADIGSPDAPAIAVIESAGIAGSDGVMITGLGRGEANDIVNAERPALVAKLKRDPNGDELLEAVLAGAHAPRLRVPKV